MGKESAGFIESIGGSDETSPPTPFSTSTYSLPPSNDDDPTASGVIKPELVVSSKERKESFGRNNAIIEYEYANYDIVQAEADYTAVADELKKARSVPRVLMITNDPKQPKVVITINFK